MIGDNDGCLGPDRGSGRDQAETLRNRASQPGIDDVNARSMTGRCSGVNTAKLQCDVKEMLRASKKLRTASSLPILPTGSLDAPGATSDVANLSQPQRNALCNGFRG